MRETAIEPESAAAPPRTSLTTLGILVGVVMPIVAALLYPTYTHLMQPPWLEWSRLIELPFVLCEAAVIRWASRQGLDITTIWRVLPADVKMAAITLLVGIFASSFFISAQPLQSLCISLITVVHLLFALSVFHLAGTAAPRDARSLVTVLGVGLPVLALLTVLKFGFPPPLSEVPGGRIEWGSAVPGFISVRHFGSWTGAVAAAFTAVLLYGHDERRLSWAHLCYFLAAAMTVWSGTRAAILAVALATVIVVAMNRRLPTFRAVGMLMMLTGAALTSAWLLLPPGDPDFRLFNPTDVDGVSALAAGRLELWAATWARWLDSPMFGWGSGSTFWEVFLGWTHTQPHNAVLQFLISWGAIGAAGALWLLGRAIVAVHATTLRQPRLQPLCTMLYTLLLMSLVEGMLHYPRFIMLIMILFAVILSARRRGPPPEARLTPYSLLS